MDKPMYMEKIRAAGPVGLVVVNFEMIIDFLRAGQVGKAREALDTLISALDFNVSLSFDFHEIYKYAYAKLVDAEFSGKPEAVDEVIELMETLLEGWRNVDEVPLPAADNKIYTGLTYGRDGQKLDYSESEGEGYTA